MPRKFHKNLHNRFFQIKICHMYMKNNMLFIFVRCLNNYINKNSLIILPTKPAKKKIKIIKKIFV